MVDSHQAGIGVLFRRFHTRRHAVTPRARGLSARVKLTLSYTGFLLVAGIALMLFAQYVLQFVPTTSLIQTNAPDGSTFAPNRGDLLRVFWPRAFAVLGFLTVVGLLGGWFLAGRMLAPLTRITAVTRAAAEGVLDRRIELPGRRDEFRELADTFDSMLDRVEGMLAEQRRFAANASHELRTPHAVIRTMLEVAEAAPDRVDVPKLVARLSHTNDRAIALTEALLLLARAEGEPTTDEEIDLTATVLAAIAELAQASEHAQIRVDTTLSPARVRGNPALVHAVAINLIRNALIHNTAGDGWVRIVTETRGDLGLLRVENSGQILAPELVATLTEPFQRGAARRHDPEGGVGLGLAIVSAILRTHAGTLSLAPRPEGGLVVIAGIPTSAR
ncbi:two-component system sensor histidine kinase VanS [Mycetocola sp. BIGb0189]|uniref:sensor histidine kinase n=1 Tax=Mycetocola sp. BIGb0189 TaxID=2940604 RepID=UPI002169EA17|nr:HAMP domain-containing sensor histidine kinase [Mycetocola sp. BIGb0189]MCS4276592.1 two-component system sensor histidine kinase VanS [Mycetocola sp. BIGb0189]